MWPVGHMFGTPDLRTNRKLNFFVLTGKTPGKDDPLGGALLSEVSTLFEMLMTQKADSHPGPRPDVLYRLSAAYRRSLGLDGNTTTSTPQRSGVDLPSGLNVEHWKD